MIQQTQFYKFDVAFERASMHTYLMTHPHRLVIDLNTTRLKNKSVLHLGIGRTVGKCAGARHVMMRIYASY
ncbi:MAG: hypothetical protein R3E08_02980 [Thiotrichaceae bacterium]